MLEQWWEAVKAEGSFSKAGKGLSSTGRGGSLGQQETNWGCKLLSWARRSQKLLKKIEDTGYPMRNLSGEGQLDTPDNSINTSSCTVRHHALLLIPNETKAHYLLCILLTLSSLHIHIYTNQKAENRWCRQGMKSGAGTMGLIMTDTSRIKVSACLTCLWLFHSCTFKNVFKHFNETLSS